MTPALSRAWASEKLILPAVIAREHGGLRIALSTEVLGTMQNDILMNRYETGAGKTQIR